MIKDLCFEIIKTCPNNCLFCSSCSGLQETEIISFELFKKTIDYLILNGGIEEISISGGEPLLHPDLFKIIRYCKKNNIRTVLFTSGIKRRIHFTEEEKQDLEENLRKQYKSYLDEVMEYTEYEKLINNLMKRYLAYDALEFDSLSNYDCLYFKQLGLDKIVFDFQAWNKEVYNKIMGTDDFYELILSSVIKASKSGIATDAHFIPTKINYKELPEIIEMLNVAEFKQLSILNFVPQGRGRENESILMLTDDEFKDFLSIYEENKDKFNGVLRVGIPLQGSDKHKCTAGLDKLVIKYDGTVLPCPAFKEYDIAILNKMGIKTPNIKDNLEDVKIHNGTRSQPLCKKLYSFRRSIQ